MDFWGPQFSHKPSWWKLMTSFGLNYELGMVASVLITPGIFNDLGWAVYVSKQILVLVVVFCAQLKHIWFNLICLSKPWNISTWFLNHNSVWPLTKQQKLRLVGGWPTPLKGGFNPMKNDGQLVRWDDDIPFPTFHGKSVIKIHGSSQHQAVFVGL